MLLKVHLEIDFIVIYSDSAVIGISVKTVSLCLLTSYYVSNMAIVLFFSFKLPFEVVFDFLLIFFSLLLR